jgi:chromosome segregation ATPase
LADYNSGSLPNIYITDFLFDGVSAVKTPDLDDFVENSSNDTEIEDLEIKVINIDAAGSYELMGEITGAMVGGGKPRRGGMGNIAMKYNNNENDEQEMKKLNEEYVKTINEYNQLKNEYNICEQEYQRILRDLREIENVGIKIEFDMNKLNQSLKEINDKIKAQNEQGNKNNSDIKQIERIKSENKKLLEQNNNLNEEMKESKKEL